MKRRRRKQVAAILLLLAVVVTQIPAYEVKADSTEFIIDGTTLVSYEGSESSVTIPGKITKIAREAFENNGSLVKVSIPDSVEVIESGAFAECKNLNTVSIPKSVVEIGPSAFAGCEQLESITIDRYNTTFLCSDGALYDLKDAKLVQVFAGRKGDRFTIPNYITDIDRYAFWGCEALETVIVGSGLNSLPAYAFSNMPNLKDIVFPTSITEIEMKAFENCTALGDLYLPPAIVKIHDTAFDGCRNLNILSEEGSVAQKFFEEFEATNVAITEEEDNSTNSFYVEDASNLWVTTSENTVDKSTAANNGQTTDAVKEAYEANVDNQVYVNNQVYVEDDDDSVLGKTKIVGGKAVVFVDNSKATVYDGTTKIQPDEEVNIVQAERTEQETELAELLGEEVDRNYLEDILNTKYVIVNGNTIADRAFYKEETMTSYNVPGTIKRIGDFSFARSSLTSVYIPYGVEEIGYGAFYACTNLLKVAIPATVTKIEPSAFAKTAWFENWIQGGNVDEFLVVGDGILLAYKGDSANVVIPQNVKRIGPEVFMNHTEIVNVTLPDGLIEVGEDAFNGCANLKNISGGSKLEHIRDRAFNGCQFETIRIPENVVSVGLMAYGNITANESIVFLGKELPKISYEKTATRLSNQAYRNAPFIESKIAVVDNSITDFKETVLDEGELGFEGIICSIIKEPTLQQKGEVSVKKVQSFSNETKMDIPNSVWIYGKEYYVTNIETDAIESKLIQEVITEEINAESVESASEEEADNEETVSANGVISSAGNVTAVIKKDDWKDKTGIYADLTAQNENLELVIDEMSDDTWKKMAESFGLSTDPFSFVPFEMNLYDTQSDIPISKLGSQRMTVCLPIAETLANEPVVAVCPDENGQLEYISCVQRMIDEKPYAVFEVKHFSPFALLCGTNVPQEYQNQFYDKVAAKKAAAYSEKYGKKDESPDTGDTSIHPKWFLMSGLLMLAGYLFMKK